MFEIAGGIILAMFLMMSPAIANERPASITNFPANARYVIVQPGVSAWDVFLLDTKTGRMWTITQDAKVGHFLSPATFLCMEKGTKGFDPDCTISLKE